MKRNALLNGLYTTTLLLLILTVYGLVGSLDEENNDSVLSTWFATLTISNEN